MALLVLSIVWVTIMTAPRSVMLGALRGVTRAAGLSSWTEKAMIPDKPSEVLETKFAIVAYRALCRSTLRLKLKGADDGALWRERGFLCRRWVD